jgi:RNA polymerase sigma factor (sigma-70 family)
MRKYLPFPQQYDEADERTIIEEAQKGSSKDVERLIRQHQQFVYNVALKFVHEPEDAADLTQEAFLNVLTKLSQFGFKSSFRTWLYRIVMNHFLNSKRGKSEVQMHSLDDLRESAEHFYDDQEMSYEEQLVAGEEIRLLRNKYMLSTLLCLDRQQRMVLILGFVFRVPSADAAPLLRVTQENFRKQLQRAKEDLFNFMDNKCGLMNPKNPCRCHKKTKGFVKVGLLDPERVKFDSLVVQTIKSVVDEKNRQLDDLMEGKYRQLLVRQLWSEPTDRSALINGILSDPGIKEIYGLK